MKRKKIALGFLVTGMIGVGLCFLIHPAHRMYVVEYEGASRIEIPQKIVKEKDCKAYKDFVYSNLDPMLFSGGQCPWVETEMAKMVDITVGTLRFKIPQAYVAMAEKDGENGTYKRVFLELRGADMKPVMPAFKTKNEKMEEIYVNVPNQDISIVIEQPSRPVTDQLLYEDASRLASYYKDKEKYAHYQPVWVRDYTDTGLSEYTSGPSRMFVKGNVYSPKYWIQCSNVKKASRWECERRITYFDNRLEVKFTLRHQALFGQRQNVERRILEKLDTFLVEEIVTPAPSGNNSQGLLSDEDLAVLREAAVKTGKDVGDIGGDMVGNMVDNMVKSAEGHVQAAQDKMEEAVQPLRDFAAETGEHIQSAWDTLTEWGTKVQRAAKKVTASVTRVIKLARN